MDAHDLKRGLSEHNNGTDQVYFHSLNKRINYTDGVRFFARNAGGGAYWLLDILVTQPEILEGVKKHGFCVVILNVKDSKAVLTVARDYSSNEDKDGNDMGGTFDQVAYTRTIDFTDCPDGVWKFYFQDNMIMLPSEY